MKLPRIFIVGAGGFGREVFSWIQALDAKNAEWCFSGFLAENPTPPLPLNFPATIVGNPLNFDFRTGDKAIVAIGDPKAREKVSSELDRRGLEFPTFLHPSVVIGNQCRIGRGCIICPGAVLTTNVTLGDFVIVNLNSTIGHDATIGSYSTLSCHVDVTGWAKVGESVFLGSHASVLPRAKIGAMARVGAGSVVLRAVRPGTTVFGVPAKQIIP